MGIKKKLRRDENVKRKDYDIRKDAMAEAVKELARKHKIDLVPIIQATDQGIYPLIAFVDITDKLEELNEEKKENIQKIEVG